jgi:hypothetical protein
MGTVFKKPTTRPVPAGAEIARKGGERVRGKIRPAPLTTGTNGADRIVTESTTYFAKFRDAAGVVVTRPTGCRDRQAAEHLLKKWDREAEQVKAGTLDGRVLDHLAASERSLVAAGVSDVYRANVLRAVRRVAAYCGFATPADSRREPAEDWPAARVAPCR